MLVADIYNQEAKTNIKNRRANSRQIFLINDRLSNGVQFIQIEYRVSDKNNNGKNKDKFKKYPNSQF